ncbi:hypothetical protein AAFF_G00232380 [Aldrovandia affinis]|uniref:Uncharacterized protein n=1 Tax=Aldrovandia affinis TaxID=143900 RepID=A0AAD7W3N2_9TELE|nr:hypothetical protein AAFF_G00232380 [Aldrovandia affinis]
MRSYLAIVLLNACSVMCQHTGLFPAILNLASNAEISTNATCGETQPEMYCKLVEHVPDRRLPDPQCQMCDSHSTNTEEQHPITNAIDGTNQWWQSPSIKNGHRFHWVTITLDLRQIFQVAYIIVKAANSPRPGNWILERSMDGVEFRPWQYYATSDTECLTRYNVTTRRGPPIYRRNDEVVCTSYYSRLLPLENGEIHTSLINRRPSAGDLSPELLEFTSARYIRLRLQRVRTLNADLMTLSHRHPNQVDRIVTRRYYYSIKDISVGGMCICHGHALSCPWNPVSKRLQCACEHNTCGESCNKCCPGYLQELWQPGTFSDSNVCQKCNCNNKSGDCYYNQTVADSKLSMDARGRWAGGGVCLNCSQHTAGTNCETCTDGYFRLQEVSPYDDYPCAECSCHPIGSLHPKCVKDDTHAKPEQGLRPGQCPCREGFTGERCDHCASGRRDFPLCARCNCSLDGSLNTDPCAECVCKENVADLRCDHCKSGYYNLQGSNPKGCTECFCFGVTDVCESAPWTTIQVVKTDGSLLPAPQRDCDFTTSRSKVDNHTTNGNLTGSGSRKPHFLSSWVAPKQFLGNKLAAYGGLLNYTVSYNVPMGNVDKSLLFLFDVIIEGNGMTLRQAVGQQLRLAPQGEQHVAMEMTPWNFVDHLAGRVAKGDDLMIILANVTELRVCASINASTSGILRLHTLSLEMGDPSGTTPRLSHSVELCSCPQGHTGTSCEDCISGFYRAGGVLFGGTCLRCECNSHASQCDSNGTCLGCNHNTAGSRCGRCQAGFYGDPSVGTAEDCQRCACPLTVASNNFSPTCYLSATGEVTCDQCQQGYTGAHCEWCTDGYYGDPTFPWQGCGLCDCHGNVDPLEPGHCDPSTGECLKCVDHTAGQHCEQCRDGYFGDAIVAKDCQTCGCHGYGSNSSICDVTTGRCSCRPNVVGEKCNHCKAEHHGLLSGTGCVACNCSCEGSVSQECDEGGGCHCYPGVTGHKCNRCQHGFYNFQGLGCTVCDCDHAHGNCDPETGRCICPPHTRGEKCELCEEGHWGHDSVTGCKHCDCSGAGCLASQCDLTSGRCRCRPGFSGEKCDRCAVGFRAFPECTACNCNANGTQEEYCDEGLGVCGCEEAGNCACKDNVGGRGCDECKRGTFGLTNHNPAGCSRCFCSGVSSSCMERGGLVRVSITLGAGQVQLCSVSQRSLNGCLESLQNLSVLTNANLPQSSYWRLPAQFLGMQLMSYGGKLAYATSFASLNGTGQANSDPQLLMGGGRLRKVIMYLDWPAPPIRVKTSQEIPLTEAKWKYFNSVSDRVVTRLDFMSVLSNIEYILIKASYGRGTQQSRLLNVTMATAVDAEKGPAGGEVARLIEVCECPPVYTGLSCQECALGYYRQQFAEKNLKGHYTLARPCVPCQCHNHSLSCDPDTGKCQDCQHNTVGEQCNLCAPGHYGKVKGSISDCSLCACPRGNKKSFSPTCILEGISDFHCDSCERGYEGQHCQRCSAGYHGNPLAPNGRCRPCRCSVAGSLHPSCDPLTGRCRCRAGARGHLCRGCEKRHVLLGGLCVPCNDQCTRALLGKVAGLECSVRPLNLTGVVAAPYSLFRHLTNITNEIKILSSPRKDVTSVLQRVEEQLADLPEDITRLQHRADQLFGDGEDLAQSTEQSLNQSRELLELITVAQVSFQAWEAVRSLNGTLDEASSIHGEGQVASMLENMRKMDYAHSNITVSNELSSAEAALQQVMRKYHRPQQAAGVLAKTLAASLSKGDLQLQSAWTLLTTARNHSSHTFLLLGNISTTLEKLQDLNHSVFSVTREVGVELGAAQDLLLKALAMGEGVVNATSPRGELDHWMSQLRKRMDVLEASRVVVVDLLHRAEDHVQGLNVDPWPIHSAVYGLRDVCLDGGAASRLTSAIAEAERLAESTGLAATSTLQLTVLSEEGSVTGTAARAVQRSTKILAASLALSNKTAFFIADSAHTKKRQGWIGDSVRNINSSLPATPTHILESSLANSTSEGRLVANRKAEMANASLLLAQHRMDDLSQQLEKSTVAVALANDNMRSTNELVSATEKNVRAAEFEVREMERNLSEIRELIGQARQQASSIKVGMSVDGDCVRAYRPEISSSNFNTLTMTVKTSQPDNLLFYMGSNYSVDFMALEMHHGKVTFLWDLGSGYAELEYPDVQINNSKWHHIHATRFGKQGSLMIQEVMSDQKPAVRTASSPGSATVLGVNQSTLIFVGSPAGQIKKSPAVKMTNFTGCLGEVSLNGKNIGLWNYAMKQGPCRGCFMSLQAEEPSFHFDGNGFSVVEKSLRSTATHAVLLFKTFSPNGLLLYLASNGTRDFLSIELVEGKLQLTFDLGSGALTLTSTKAYNMGKWYRITLLRTRQKGILVVMDAQVPSGQRPKPLHSRPHLHRRGAPGMAIRPKPLH